MEALGGASGISKPELSRICQGLDEQVKAFLGLPHDHARFPYVHLDATWLDSRLGRNLQVVSRAMVVAIGINALGYREVLGIAVGDSEAEGVWHQFLGFPQGAGPGPHPVGDLGRPPGADDSDQTDVPGQLLAVRRQSGRGAGCTSCATCSATCQGCVRHGGCCHVDAAGRGPSAVFLIQATEQVRAQWQRVTEMLRKQSLAAVPVLETARDEVLAFLHFPQELWRKIWCTNPLEPLNVAPGGAL